MWIQLSDSDIQHFWPCSCSRVRLISGDQIRPMRDGGNTKADVTAAGANEAEVEKLRHHRHKDSF